MLRKTLVVLSLWLIHGLVVAGDLHIQGPAARVALVELYTSEGCSSCPPADRWMSRLEGDPRLWREIVPVAFHVDYWDYIGWTDRFASSDYSNRQREHRVAGHLRSVYTPGFVVGGSEWKGFFRGRELSLETGQHPGPIDLRIRDGMVTAGFAPAADLRGPLELNIAVLGFGLNTDVEAGENSGRLLRHDFVVLAHERLALRPDGEGFTASGPLPRPHLSAERRAVAAWVSEPGDPFPIQAAGGWLP